MIHVKKYIKLARMCSKSDDVLHAYDVFGGMLRGQYKSFARSDKELLSAHPKRINKFMIDPSKLETDPIAEFEAPTDIQRLIVSHFDQLRSGGAFCYNANCGSGKSRAAINIIRRLGLKTLIVSARNAVNDQWETELRTLYPTLSIVVKDADDSNSSDGESADIYILTPQYLSRRIDWLMSEETQADAIDFFMNMRFDLVIYDEIHSLLSEKFGLTLALPFLLKLHKVIKYLPYMIGLSATIPAKTTQEYQLIEMIFGAPYKVIDKITAKPVYFIDYRDEHRDKADTYDNKFRAASDIRALKYFYKHISKHGRPFICTNYKGIVITSSIDTSIYAALYLCRLAKTQVLIMRAINEKSIFLVPEDIPKDFAIKKSTATYDNIKRLGIGTYGDYKDFIDKSALIVGTYHRLKEGFNCKNITWGICTKFIYSESARVQLLGRIRRSSNNETLNNRTRIFFVNSGRIPLIFNPRTRKMAGIAYDLNYESMLFRDENYIRISMDSYFRAKK